MQAKDIDDLEVLRLIDLWWSAVRNGELPDYESRHPAPVLSRTFPHKVVEAKFKSLHRRGLIEFGGNVLGSWLTPAGVQLLTELGAAMNRATSHNSPAEDSSS